jgi:hypothetical protein
VAFQIVKNAFKNHQPHGENENTDDQQHLSAGLDEVSNRITEFNEE